MKVAIVGGTGAFGRALAKRLHEIGKDEVLVGSRDAERAQATASELGIAGGLNHEIVAGADLVVLAVKSNGTLETARELAAAIGTTPVLCVASDLRFTKEGVLPGRHQGSLAEEVARIVRGPVASGLQSFAARNLVEGDPGDALVCGGDERGRRDRYRTHPRPEVAASTGTTPDCLIGSALASAERLTATAPCVDESRCGG